MCPQTERDIYRQECQSKQVGGLQKKKNPDLKERTDQGHTQGSISPMTKKAESPRELSVRVQESLLPLGEINNLWTRLRCEPTNLGRATGPTGK